MVVRPLHSDDGPAICDLLNHSVVIGNIPYDPGMEHALIFEWLGRHESGVHRYVALAGGEITGLIILTHKMRPRLNHSGTISMAASTSSHYQETRQALLATALELADNWLNLSRLELEISTNAITEIDFFQDHGFEIEGTRVMATYREGSWQDLLCLARLRTNPFWPESVTHQASVERNHKGNKLRRQIEKIEIRPANFEDALAYYEMLRDPAICRTTLQLPSQEIWQTEERLRDSQPWIHRFTADADSEIVGSIALVQVQNPGQSHVARIAMKVHSDYWGLGIGTRLMQAATDLADNWLNTIRIELDVNCDNPAGINLYHKSGFIIEGTKRFHAFGDGRWVDSYFMARIQKK